MIGRKKKFRQSAIFRSVFAGRFHSAIALRPLRYTAGKCLARYSMAFKDMAYKIGYTSQAVFSRAFQRITGHPPWASRQF